jgi:hypothetical protein
MELSPVSVTQEMPNPGTTSIDGGTSHTSEEVSERVGNHHHDRSGRRSRLEIAAGDDLNAHGSESPGLMISLRRVRGATFLLNADNARRRPTNGARNSLRHVGVRFVIAGLEVL